LGSGKMERTRRLAAMRNEGDGGVSAQKWWDKVVLWLSTDGSSTHRPAAQHKGVHGTGGDDGGLPVWLEDGGMAAQGRGAAVPGRCCAGRAGTAA